MHPKTKEFLIDFFGYDTPKIVLINNMKVGILCKIVQLAIFCYVIGYAIIWEKGYQEFCEIESAVTTKIKGIVFTNFSDSEFDPLVPDPSVYKRIWNTADYIVPPSENNAFFVITNIAITSNQTQSSCPEDPGVRGSHCTSDDDCTRGTSLPIGNGVFTGKCVPSDINATINVCEILGWCPVERDVNTLKNGQALLSETKKFTVMIKNFVEFPDFGIKRRNIPENVNTSYLRSCNNDPETDPLCPMFKLETIVQGDYDKMAIKGAVIAIIIDWECNFDYDESLCYPKYSFRRLDDEKTAIAPGLNFRYANYYGDSLRTLYKAYGIKFIVNAQGKGGRFSFVPLLLNIGSGLGLLAMASVICDILVIYIVKKRDMYKGMIFETPGDANTKPSSDLRESRV